MQLPWFLNCFAMQLSKFHTSMIDSFLDTVVESCLSCTKHRRTVRLMTTKMSPVAVTYWRKDTHSEAFQNVFLLTWPVDDIFVITLLCHDTVSARMGVGQLLLPAQLPWTHWAMICVIWRLALTVSDVCLKLVCFQSTSTYSALEVSHFMCYINSRHAYIVTYLLTHTGHLFCATKLTQTLQQFHIFSFHEMTPPICTTVIKAFNILNSNKIYKTQVRLVFN